ncbi:Alkanesulfonates transport system permease protein [Rhodovastum atsumiense]|nr:ABC transporter permease [Rhodovastum atsumiense]CAH2601288.1 Alkanesulfonates transport system permease protein [Rhodovastum atsumiense]
MTLRFQRALRTSSRRPVVLRLLTRLFMPVAALLVPLVLLLAWSLAARHGLLPDQILPDPRVVLQTLRESAASGELLEHTLVSLQRVAVGFAAGAAAGLALGTALGLSRTLRGLLDGSFLALAQIPVLGWLPLMILLVGLDEELKVIVIGWSAFVPVVLNTTQGMRDVPPALREVGQVLTFDPWSMFTRIVLPAALPAIFTGLREGLANSWQTLVAVELFASSEGLGFLMSWGRQLFQLDLVLVVVLVVGSIGFVLNWSLGRVEQRLRRWQVSAA